MSHTEATSCKLPLLDGEVTSEAQVVTTELELENIERLQSLGNGDTASFDDLLCTAWGLLLRCYTGQDNIAFHFRLSNDTDLVLNSDAPRVHHGIFRMVFEEHQSLSDCLPRAKDSCANYERGGPSLASTVSDSASSASGGVQNTHIWLQGGNHDDTQDSAIQKVYSVQH